MRGYLKELRAQKGFTQIEVAKKLDVSESYYSLIESGARKQEMPLSFAQKISAVFGVTVDFVIEKENALKGEG